MKPANERLTEKQAAEYLGTEPETMRSWRFRKVGPPFLKLMGKVKYELADLDAFIAASRVVPGQRKRGRR